MKTCRPYGGGSIAQYATKKGTRSKVRWIAPISGFQPELRERQAVLGGFVTLQDATNALRRKLIEVEDGRLTAVGSYTVAEYFSG